MKLGRPKNSITGNYIAYCNDDSIEIYRLDKDGLLITVNGKIIPEIYRIQKITNITSERFKENVLEHDLYIKTEKQPQLDNDSKYKYIFNDVGEAPHLLGNDDYGMDEDFVIHE